MNNPKFNLNSVVYIRSSAIRGHLEPITLCNVSYDQYLNTYVYNYTIYNNIVAPIIIREDEIIDKCTAYNLQLSFYNKELINAEKQLSLANVNCTDIINNPIDTSKKFKPNKPMYDVGDVVYLKQSAESIGRLESYKIDKIKWNNSTGYWSYIFYIKKRPGINTTVGDMNDLRKEVILMYDEPNLVPYCNAITYRVQYISNMIDIISDKIESECN